MALEVKSSTLFTHPIPFFGVSPSGKARDFDFRIRRFKSCHPSQSTILIFIVGVSPSGKATDSDSVIRELKSLHPSHHPLAQPVEHLTFNQGVPSSNLGWMTKR